MAMSQAERDAQDAEWESVRPQREAIKKIAELEAQLTPRRIREAILGTDGGWLSAKEAEITAERAKLK